MKKLLILSIIICIYTNTFAQFGKDVLNKYKETAKQKTTEKADQRFNTELDNGLNKTDSIGKGGKKKRKKNKQTETEQPLPETQAAPIVEETNETVILTNIKCLSGKKKIETILSEMQGVNQVLVDVKTGELTVTYIPKNTSYKAIIAEVSGIGFTADGKKPAAGIKNPCIK